MVPLMKIFLISIVLLVSYPALAWQFSAGVYKSLLDVQDKKGDEVKNPFSPVISVGTNFQLSGSFGFSPQLGYIYHTVESDDSYGKYKMSTIFLLYDFIWIPSDYQFLALRFGLGTFRKTITGEGGTVTIPNQNTTATAYRPESSTSYSSTFNLGGEFRFDVSSDWFNGAGARIETFIFRPLSQEFRSYTYQLALVGYF